MVHINSEQSRRKNIKSGFDLLKILVPSLSQNTNAKISKAALLHKGGDYLQQLMADKEDLSKQIEAYRTDVTSLNEQIEGFQNALAVSSGTGGSGTGHETRAQMKEMFDSHVRNCTLQNWKYWIFSRLMKPLLESFNASVNTGSVEDMTRSSMSWLDQHCSLIQLRPSAMQSLKALAITTDIIDNPKKIAMEAVSAAAATPSPPPPADRRIAHIKDDDDDTAFLDHLEGTTDDQHMMIMDESSQDLC